MAVREMDRGHQDFTNLSKMSSLSFQCKDGFQRQGLSINQVLTRLLLPSVLQKGLL